MHASRKRPASAICDSNDLIATTLADEPRAAAPSKFCVSCLINQAQTEKSISRNARIAGSSRKGWLCEVRLALLGRLALIAPEMVGSNRHGQRFGAKAIAGITLEPEGFI